MKILAEAPDNKSKFDVVELLLRRFPLGDLNFTSSRFSSWQVGTAIAADYAQSRPSLKFNRIGEE